MAAHGSVFVFWLIVITYQHSCGLYQDPAKGILQPEGLTEAPQNDEVSVEDEDEDEENGGEEEDVDPETLKHLPTTCHGRFGHAIKVCVYSA